MLVFPSKLIFFKPDIFKRISKAKAHLLKIQQNSSGIHSTGLILCSYCPCACSYFPTSQGNLRLGGLASCMYHACKQLLKYCWCLAGNLDFIGLQFLSDGAWPWRTSSCKAPFNHSGRHPGTVELSCARGALLQVACPWAMGKWWRFMFL